MVAAEWAESRPRTAPELSDRALAAVELVSEDILWRKAIGRTPGRLHARMHRQKSDKCLTHRAAADNDIRASVGTYEGCLQVQLASR
jgi:hypothetical protein